MKPSDNPVVGRWRIVEADLWDRDHLDLCGPASLIVRANGHGEIAFGAMQASLDVDYGADEIGFTWAGFDGMTEVSGAGSAEHQDDGSPAHRVRVPSRRRGCPQSRSRVFFNSLLILLRHNVSDMRVTVMQHGHRSSLRTSSTISVRRMVEIEFPT
jgi:hypothetical protein